MIKKYMSTVLALGLIFSASQAIAEPKNKTQSRFGKKAFKKADNNGDGKVSEAEFLEIFKLKFKKMDLNKDGSIDENERAKAVVKKKKSKKNSAVSTPVK